MKPPAAFEVLGLTREAAPEEIRRACRRLALRYHPDRNPDDPNAEKKFKELVVSYEKIKNLPARPSPSTASAEKDMDRPIDPDLEEIISEIFRNARNKTERRPVRGSDLTASLELTFEEAALGAERELRLRRRVSCDVCRGGGGYPHGRSERCPHCGGGGELSFRRGSAALSIPCSSCRGEGVRFLDPCPACSGEGRRQREEIVPAVLPPATADGAQIKQRGKGDEGLDFGEPGDLYIAVSVRPHEVFRREGNDIHLELPIRFARSIIGGKTLVPTLEGNVMMRLPIATRSGTVFRLRGKGLSPPGGGGGGDQHVKISVLAPALLRRLHEKWISLTG